MGTTAEKGYGTGGGRLPDNKVGKHIEFRGIDSPDKWDTPKDKINLIPDILERCAQRVIQQRRFDKKPLAKALCWQCGRILLTTVNGAHTFLVEPPHGMSCEQAPAMAYLRTLDACSLTFEYVLNDKYRWYSCAQCRSLKIQPDQYVGKLMNDDGDLLPVQEWQMKRPSVLAALNNQYE